MSCPISIDRNPSSAELGRHKFLGTAKCVSERSHRQLISTRNICECCRRFSKRGERKHTVAFTMVALIIPCTDAVSACKVGTDSDEPLIDVEPMLTWSALMLAAETFSET